MPKAGGVGPMRCIGLSAESFSLQSGKLVDFVGHYPKETTNKREAGEETRRIEFELRSPVEPSDGSSHTVRSPATTLSRNKSVDDDIKTSINIQSASGTINFRQSREFYWENAWQRKRDEKRRVAQNKYTRKPDGVGNSTSQEGKRRSSKTRNPTDDDFQELKGCIDLGFSFGEGYSPDLFETLPALKVYYAITQTYRDSQAGGLSPVSTVDSVVASSDNPFSSWQIRNPGDHPEQVKTKLRHWAQAVACTVRRSC